MKVNDIVYFKYLGLEHVEVTRGIVLCIDGNILWVKEGERHITIEKEFLRDKESYDAWQLFYAKQKEISEKQIEMEELRKELIGKQ